MPSVIKPIEPIEPTAAPKPTSFALKPSVSIGSLNEISTKLSESLTASEQRVADQREAGVYKLSEATHTLMGADAESLILTMQSLDAALVEKTPEIRTLSREIRRNLEVYPELVHILTDQQLHIMVQGYLTIAGVKTTPTTAAGKTASANKKADSAIKAIAGKSLDELF